MSAAFNTVPLTLEALDPLPVDTVCLFVSEDERPLGGAAGFVDWRLCGQLSRLLVDGFFKGTRGESLLLPRMDESGRPGWWFSGSARVARRSIRACSGRRCPRPRTCSNRARVDSVALELPGRGAMPAQGADVRFQRGVRPGVPGGSRHAAGRGPVRPSA